MAAKPTQLSPVQSSLQLADMLMQDCDESVTAMVAGIKALLALPVEGRSSHHAQHVDNLLTRIVDDVGATMDRINSAAEEHGCHYRGPSHQTGGAA